MDKIKQIEKRMAKSFIVFLIMLIPIAILFFIGLSYYKNNPNEYKANVLFICTLVLFVLLVIGYDSHAILLKRKLIIANKELIIEKINNEEGVNEFTSLDGKKVIFKQDGLYINDILLKYDEIDAYFIYTTINKLFGYEGKVCVVIGNKENKVKLDLTGDILREINNNLNDKLNQENLKVFIENFKNFKLMNLVSKDYFIDIPLFFKKSRI